MSLKVKGTKRNLIQDFVGKKDFLNATKKKEPARKLRHFSIKKLYGAMYVHSQTKRILSCFTTKRIFMDKYADDFQSFSYPLHARPYLF